MRYVCALIALTSLLAGCGGGTTTPPPSSAPAPSTTIPPLTSATESITPAASTTLAPLPNIGGIYGGQIVLPPGSGRATLTFSLNPPRGIKALTELTPAPQIAYITITAQSPFTLAALPGLNLTGPTLDMAIDMWLNYYDGTAWSSAELGWPSTTPGVSVNCFAVHSGAVSLQQAQSVYLGINGDDVLPTPISSSTPPPCPQSAATPIATLAPNSCGMPPPVPSPFLFLSYPPPGSTNVSIDIGELIVAGQPYGFYDDAKINMAPGNNTSVPVGAYTAAPSPLPSPFATPSGFGGDVPYYAAPIPTLSPATAYTLTYTYTDFNGVPPSCTGPVTLQLGSFTTH